MSVAALNESLRADVVQLLKLSAAELSGPRWLPLERIRENGDDLKTNKRDGLSAGFTSDGTRQTHAPQKATRAQPVS